MIEAEIVRDLRGRVDSVSLSRGCFSKEKETKEAADVHHSTRSFVTYWFHYSSEQTRELQELLPKRRRGQSIPGNEGMWGLRSKRNGVPYC